MMVVQCTFCAAVFLNFIIPDICLNEEVAYKRGRAREERVTKNGDSHAALNGSVLYRPFFVA